MNMKTVKFFIISFLALISLNACAQEVPVSDSEDTKVSSEGKILIVYFSRAGYNYPNQWLDLGHTARIAGYIKDFTDGDTFEIVPVVPYPDDYEETKTISTYERDNDLRPDFIGEIENIEDYDIIFIGGPVWYGGMPMILHTFYDRYKDKINGKTVVPFDTHAGSGIADYVTMARIYCPDSDVLNALAVQGTNSFNAKPDVKNWLVSIGIIEKSGSASIASVSMSNENETLFFSLTGIRIKEPEKGFFIKVQDGNIYKILK